jgi:hypothetical protein
MNRIRAEACAARAMLRGPDRASATGLTQIQLDTACVGEQTKLPAELRRQVLCVAVGKKRIR